MMCIIFRSDFSCGYHTLAVVDRDGNGVSAGIVVK